MRMKFVTVAVAVSSMAVAMVTNVEAAEPYSERAAQNHCPPQVSDPSYEALLEKFLVPGKLDAEFFKSLADSPESEARMEAFRKRKAEDWAYLCKFRAQNLALPDDVRPTAVFFGDSITENWISADPDMFSNDILDRGIRGQTSSQLLVRFYQDVVALRPRVVHIMVGTNDIAGNTGPMRPGDFENNIRAMLDLASSHDTRAVLAGVPPSRLLGWSNVDPRTQIRRLNLWLEAEAKQRGLVYVDYATVLATEDGGIDDAFSNDGVHPNRTGYARMRPLAERAIGRALLGSQEGDKSESPTISSHR